MQARADHTVRICILAASLIVGISFFFPWLKVVLVPFSAYDLASGAFSGGKPSLSQKGFFVILILPTMALLQLFIETVRRVSPHGLSYFIYGVMILVATFYYLRVSTWEIGGVLAIIGGLVLATIGGYQHKGKDLGSGLHI